ncbi:anti-sigma factor domain-containing protein [Kutzneria sp. CA-103260]|uniref:anti-sigma factor n=1 Tax=Kutzneria sp. CA-103260 TaxID=2802641 RepID=UPI001BAE01F2|nr:anti-sigma factor [Kutzneria sp. CA-103260]QUQ62838.1 Anti-sigma-K factor rskA [Kutzneria sp. CA-103260]
MDAVRDDGHCPQLENAVGWALYALEPAAERIVRTHLPACPECRQTVREIEQVGARLGESVDQHEPPPELRARLLAAIDQASPLTASPVVSIDTARRKRERRSRGLLAAAAAVVIVLGGVTTVLGVQVSRLTSQQQAQAAGESMVQSIVGSPSAARAVLTNAAGKPAAMLVTGPAGAVVFPLGLAANSPNQRYVAWGLGSSGPTALAAFDVPVGSAGPIVVDWPASADGLTRFAISLEPGRVAPAKPTNVIASGADA